MIIIINYNSNNDDNSNNDNNKNNDDNNNTNANIYPYFAIENGTCIVGVPIQKHDIP